MPQFVVGILYQFVQRRGESAVMKPEDGPNMNLWDVAAGGLWVVAAVLLVLDLFATDEGFGRLGEIGVYVLAAAVTVTIRCISQRHLLAVTRQMRNVFEMGRDMRSVR